jgi:hypothetical protein
MEMVHIVFYINADFIVGFRSFHFGEQKLGYPGVAVPIILSIHYVHF